MTNSQAVSRTFAVIARAHSGAFFSLGDGLLLLDLPGSAGPLRVEIGTRRAHAAPEFSKPLPLGLYIEAIGQSATLDTALREFTQSAQFVTQFITLASNASTEDLLPEIGVEVTPGVTEREFFQQKIDGERPLLRKRRHVRPATVARLLQLTNDHADAERLTRGIAHYHRAVQSSRPGLEIVSTHHLWMALECLTPVAIRRSGKNKSDLAAELGVEERKIEAEVRRRWLCQGDDAVYRAAKAATDGFEHGFMAFGEIYGHATSVTLKLFSLVRRALIDMLGCDAELKGDVLTSVNDTPADLTVAHYLRGKLTGPGTTLHDLAAPDEEYPRFEWINRITESQSQGLSDEYTVDLSPQLTPRLAAGVGVSHMSYEIWGTGENPIIEQSRTGEAPAPAGAGAPDASLTNPDPAPKGAGDGGGGGVSDQRRASSGSTRVGMPSNILIKAAQLMADLAEGLAATLSRKRLRRP